MSTIPVSPPRFTRPILVAVVIVGALSLAGCAAPAAAPEASSIFGDDLDSDASEAPEESEPSTEPEEEDAAVDLSSIDACAMLPKAEAEAMAKVTFMDPTNFPDPSSPSCQYDTDPYGDQPTGQASVGFGDGAKKFYDTDVQLGHVFEDVPGIGDEAHFEDNAIFVRTGDIWFSLTIVRLDDPAQYRQGIIDTAALVAARL